MTRKTKQALTHEDLRDSNHHLFLGEGKKAVVDTFEYKTTTLTK
ncbi:Imm47 family immunity protein [Brevibacillus sp. FIR094]